MFNRKQKVKSIVETGQTPNNPTNRNNLKAIVGESENTPLTPDGNRRISWLAPLDDAWETNSIYTGFSGKELTAARTSPFLSIRRESDDKEALLFYDELNEVGGLEFGVSKIGRPSIKGRVVKTTPLNFFTDLSSIFSSATSETCLKITDNAGELLESLETIDNQFNKLVFEDFPHPVYVVNSSYDKLHLKADLPIEFYNCEVEFFNITFRNCQNLKFDDCKARFNNCVFYNCEGIDIIKSDTRFINCVIINEIDEKQPVVWIDNSELDVNQALEKRTIFIHCFTGNIKILDRVSEENNPSGTNNTSYLERENDAFLIDHTSVDPQQSVFKVDKTSGAWSNRSSTPPLSLPSNDKFTPMDDGKIAIATSGNNPLLAYFNDVTWNQLTPSSNNDGTPDILDFVYDPFQLSSTFGNEVFFAIKENSKNLYVLAYYRNSPNTTYRWKNVGIDTGFELDVADVLAGDTISIFENKIYYYSPSQNTSLSFPKPNNLPMVSVVSQSKTTGIRAYSSLPPQIRERINTRYLNLPLNALTAFPSFVSGGNAWEEYDTTSLPDFSSDSVVRKHPIEEKLFIINGSSDKIFILDLSDNSVTQYAGVGVSFLSDVTRFHDMYFIGNGDLFILDVTPDGSGTNKVVEGSRILRVTTTTPYTLLRDYLDSSAGGGNNLNLALVGSTTENTFMNRGGSDVEGNQKPQNFLVLDDDTGELLNIYLFTRGDDVYHQIDYNRDGFFSKNIWLFVNDTFERFERVYSNEWIRIRQIQDYTLGFETVPPVNAAKHNNTENLVLVSEDLDDRGTVIYHNLLEDSSFKINIIQNPQSIVTGYLPPNSVVSPVLKNSNPRKISDNPDQPYI